MNDIKGIIEDVKKSNLVSNKVIKKVVEIIGQEKWNDIYDEENDICTTTGELIIALKGIAELEAENESIKNSDTLCKLIGEQKRKIIKLEAQIEKMKCCGNCKHFDFNEPNYCHKDVYREKQYVCSKWEIKEND